MAVACHAPALHAAGLGEARALSAIGEPLRVRIDLVMEPGERPDAIKARVASPSIDAGSATPAGNALTASVVATGEGKAGVVVRSAAPVYRPYVELIVALSSPAGRSDRSFVVALPPVRPGIAAPGPAAAGSARGGAMPSPAAAPASAATPEPSPAAPPAAAVPVQSVAPPPQVAAQAPLKPPQRQAVEKATPTPPTAAQQSHADTSRPTRAGTARGERRGTPAESPKSDGSVVISAIGDYATVTGDSGTPGATQSRTYRSVSPEEEASGQPAPSPPEAWHPAPATEPLAQVPAGVPPQGHAEAASGVATGQQPGMHAEVPPQTAVQVAAAPPAPPTVIEPPTPEPAGAAQTAPAEMPGDEMQAAAGKSQAPSTATPAGTPDTASGKGTWTYLEMGLALLVLVLAALVAYLARKRKAG